MQIKTQIRSIPELSTYFTKNDIPKEYILAMAFDGEHLFSVGLSFLTNTGTLPISNIPEEIQKSFYSIGTNYITFTQFIFDGFVNQQLVLTVHKVNGISSLEFFNGKESFNIEQCNYSYINNDKTEESYSFELIEISMLLTTLEGMRNVIFKSNTN